MSTSNDTLLRLSKVQAGLAQVGIDKSGVNQQQRYNYRGIDQVMNALAPLLAEHQLLIIPSTLNHDISQGTTAKGGTSYHHRVEMEYTVVGPEGTIGPFRSRGECIDYADKGLNKAQTAAYKYWVLTALCVPVEGHEDADSTTPEVIAPSPEVITPEQFDELYEIVSKLDNERRIQFNNWLRAGGCEVLEMLEARHFGFVKTQAEKMMGEQYAQEQEDTARSMQ